MELGAICYRSVPRGEAGLSCDDDGVALGPVTFVEALNSRDGGVSYDRIGRELIDSTLAAAYGVQSEARCALIYSRLDAIAAAMSEGRHVFARIAAVQMGLPEFESEAFGRLKKIAVFGKYNPNWRQEPRDRRGKWSNGDSGPVVPVIEPYSPECLQAIEAAKKLCLAEYSLRGGGLGFFG